MRARMSIVRTNHICEHREVILRDMPEHMKQISPKGTVPVMLLANGEVIEESLEIMQHVLSWKLSEIESQWVDRNDNEFKFHLDRYKYPNRYENVDSIEQRTLAKKYLDVDTPYKLTKKIYQLFKEKYKSKAKEKYIECYHLLKLRTDVK